MLDIVYMLALVWSKKGIKHLNSIIEESWREVLEPSPKIRLYFLVIICMLSFYYLKFLIFVFD